MTANSRPARSEPGHGSGGIGEPADSEGRLPDFLVIGAQKSATTSLYAYLRAHPDVRGASIPEPHFFAWAWHNGTDWYRDLFPPASDGGIVGEKSPLYLPHPRAPQRAASIVPRTRILAILRDPVDRAVSNYHHTAQRGREQREMRDAFAADEQLLGTAVDPEAFDDRDSDVNRHAYLRKGLYVEHLERWFEHYDRTHVLAIEQRQLTRAGGVGYRRVLDFLELEPRDPPSWERNTGSYETAVDPDLGARLATIFEPYNQRLFALLGVEWDWKRPRR